MKRATETAAAQLAQIERDLSVNMATQIRESVRVRAAPGVRCPGWGAC